MTKRGTAGWLVTGAFCLLSPPWTQTAIADANSDVSIMTNGACANGSALFVIANANTTMGAVATVTQTIVISGKSIVSTTKIALLPMETKTLGCALQSPAPATGIPYSWKVQAAQYQ